MIGKRWFNCDKIKLKTKNKKKTDELSLSSLLKNVSPFKVKKQKQNLIMQ